MIVILFVSFNSCSNDDGDVHIDNSAQTFLENHAGSTWVKLSTNLDSTNYYTTDYKRFNNNLITPYETYYLTADDCYDYDLFALTGDPSVTIIQNSENTLVLFFTIKGSLDNPDRDCTYTYTVIGDIFENKTEEWINGVLVDGSSVSVWKRTSTDVDGLIICD